LCAHYTKIIQIYLDDFCFMFICTRTRKPEAMHPCTPPIGPESLASANYKEVRRSLVTVTESLYTNIKKTENFHLFYVYVYLIF